MPALSRTEFSSAVTAITSAFGDPTRREIYLWAHGRSDGVTASEVAEQFELHANVARHHGETTVDLVRSTPGGVDRCVTSVGHDR